MDCGSGSDGDSGSDRDRDRDCDSAKCTCLKMSDVWFLRFRQTIKNISPGHEQTQKS